MQNYGMIKHALLYTYTCCTGSPSGTNLSAGSADRGGCWPRTPGNPASAGPTSSSPSRSPRRRPAAAAPLPPPPPPPSSAAPGRGRHRRRRPPPSAAEPSGCRLPPPRGRGGGRRGRSAAAGWRGPTPSSSSPWAVNLASYVSAALRS
uniref:Uncharacterized protein n=1 Tax=Arundo donax TaxID=35708 RepID=A0A0A8YGD1_ARUDO